MALNLPQQFHHADVHSTDPGKRVAGLTWAIDRATEWEARLKALHAEMAAELESLTQASLSQMDSHFDKDYRLSLQESMNQILAGVTEREGISDPRMRPLINQPGITRTQQYLIALRAEREAWTKELNFDDTKVSRYRLKKGCKHYQDGRPYHYGDSVDLTARQYESFKDKFEPEEPGFDTPLSEPLTTSRRKDKAAQVTS